MPPAFLALLLLATTGAWAHPHMSLESHLEFHLRGEECVAIQVEWLFDAMFSAAIIGEHDQNRDGRFDARENEAVRKAAFSNLSKYGYFIHLRRGSQRSNPASVESFEASQRGGRLVYRFRIPLGGKELGTDFSVAVFDTTFYCAIRYDEAPVSFVAVGGGPVPKTPAVTVAPNKAFPIYYNPAGAADDFRLYDRWQKGLETAYPVEIRVFFPERG